MADAPTKLYAQFDGDEVNGKVYKLGEELAEGTDAGTRHFLTEAGRFTASVPLNVNTAPPLASDKPVGDMTRQELHDTLLAGAAERLDKMPEDELRSLVERDRARAESEEDDVADDESDSLDMGGQSGDEQSQGEEGGEQSSSETSEEGGESEQAPVNPDYEALKDKPLSTLKTAELQIVAEAEGVDLTEADTNPKRVAAIQSKRDETAAG